MKYNNTNVKGYDSKKEYHRAAELKILERAGIISNLNEQVKYELIPPQYEIINGKKKCIERAISYYADFQYTENGNTIVEDVKGFRTEVYKIKKKLMLYIHGVKIREV